MKITEVIVYSLKPEHRNETDRILSELHAIVGQMDGLISQSTFRACSESHIFMDLIEWRSREAVDAAKKAFESEPVYARIAGYFDEMEYFKQFNDYQ